MLRLVRLFFTFVLAVTALGILAAAIGLAVARSSLPESACAVSEEAIAGLRLEATTEAEAIAMLGCDGVRSVESDEPPLRIETIRWRGDAWPYAAFEAMFINGVLHGTKKTWLNLELSGNKS